jgi:hypothetical protein
LVDQRRRSSELVLWFSLRAETRGEEDEEDGEIDEDEEDGEGRRV